MKQAFDDAATVEPAVVAPGPRIHTVGTLRYTTWGLVMLFVWLLWGDLVWTLMESIMPDVLPLKLDAMGASDRWAPILLYTIPGVIGFVLNPIISFRSDRHRSPRGRRIPFLIWTTPILSFFLILFGLSELLGHALYGPVTHLLHVKITQTTMVLVVMALCLIGFRFGEIFANTVYWYLFNDVVPHDKLAMFNSWFRLVGTGTGMAYSAFIFPRALDYFPYIFVGVGLLYLFGFMLMCCKVKEGQYPPPPENIDKQKGIVSSVKTYSRECFTHRFYWYFFLANAFLSVSYLSAGAYAKVRNKEFLHLDMQTIGWLDTATKFATFVMLVPLGWLADRLNPIRVYVAMAFVMFFSPVLNCVFIFKDFGPRGNAWFLLGIGLVVLPFDTLLDTVSGPMSMRLLPKERYGQFCSANGALRSLARVIMAVALGLVMEAAGAWLGRERAYRLTPVWTVVLQIPALVFLVLLLREWKRLGGNKNYAPPSV